MTGKLKFIIPLVVLVILGGAYKFVLAKPASAAKAKLDGVVYVLPKEFVLNLADSHFAKVSVALVLPHSEAPAAGAEGGATPPDGYGALPQEAAVRAVITDTLTNSSSDELTNRRKRAKLRDDVLKLIRTKTDVKPNDVLFTDVAVQ
jgi:flagellar basal body-associated protein FliL